MHTKRQVLEILRPFAECRVYNPSDSAKHTTCRTINIPFCDITSLRVLFSEIEAELATPEPVVIEDHEFLEATLRMRTLINSTSIMVADNASIAELIVLASWIRASALDPEETLFVREWLDKAKIRSQNLREFYEVS